MVKAAVFDIDGTLVSFKFDVQGTRAALLEEMAGRGFDTGNLGLTSPTQSILDAAESQALSGKGLDFLAFRKKVFSVLDGFELRTAPLTEAFPGSIEELEYLTSRGVRLAVLTNSGRVAATEVLSKARMSDFFEFVLTRDETETMKPRPDGLLKAVSMLRLPPESVCYVGDSPYDIMAARGARVRVVSVASGNYSKDRLKSEGADFAISSISELRIVLGV